MTPHALHVILIFDHFGCLISSAFTFSKWVMMVIILSSYMSLILHENAIKTLIYHFCGSLQIPDPEEENNLCI